MKTIEITTHLPADAETIWDHVTRSALLHYVAAGEISFKPDDRAGFPERWVDGVYKTWMLWKGLMPIGWQIIRIERQAPRGALQSLRDNGYGPLIARWDHMIEVSPENAGVRYVDRITIDAGAMTPLVTLFARRFYLHRQKRWRRLVANAFDYSR